MLSKKEMFIRLCDVEDTLFELSERIDKLEKKGKKKPNAIKK